MLKAPTATGLVAATSAALLLALSSCATPDAVRQFVSTACEATSQFSPFVQDIADSCIRRKLAERPVTEIADSSGAVTAACKEDIDLAPELLGSLKVLTNYFNALHSLASDQAVTYDKEIDSFAANLQAAVGFPAPATDAVKGLAKFLLDSAASGYQRAHLTSALKAADVDVTTLTNTLGRIAGVEYVRDLDNEQDSLKNRYIDAMRSAGHNDALAFLLQRHWAADLATLQKRRGAALSFQAALAKIQGGHHQLALHAGRWSAAELSKELGPFTASLQTLVKNFQVAAF
ncbi:MAG TPA: hypothetical protein VHW09_13460 [Bryobacteraceae bacterium]|jgi:hypothetical protein|nr:hypothetical protein [Bryobacteraceae bacterium]